MFAYVCFFFGGGALSKLFRSWGPAVLNPELSDSSRALHGPIGVCLGV